MKTVNISGRVAKLAWDKTVGGVHCTVAVHCTQSLQTGSQLGPNLVRYGFDRKTHMVGHLWRISSPCTSSGQLNHHHGRNDDC